MMMVCMDPCSKTSAGKALLADAEVEAVESDLLRVQLATLALGELALFGRTAVPSEQSGWNASKRCVRVALSKSHWEWRSCAPWLS